MIIIGLDPHPATFTVALLDASTARVLDTLEVDNSEVDHQLLQHWLHEHSDDDDERRWAVEGASNPFVAPLVAELLARGEHVTDIPPSLTSQYRSRRGSKKNDAVDASNAAKALLANPGLPAYEPGPNQRRLQVITRNRARLADDLKANRMALKALPDLEGSQPEDQPREILREIVAYLARQIKRLDELLGELIEEICPRILDLSGVGAVLGARRSSPRSGMSLASRRRARSPATAGQRP
jgi:transposase